MNIVDVVTTATIGVVKKSLNVTRQRTIHGANGAGGLYESCSRAYSFCGRVVGEHIHLKAEL